jgi:hypothetical protein
LVAPQDQQARALERPLALDHLARARWGVPAVLARALERPLALGHPARAQWGVPAVLARVLERPLALDHLAQARWGVPAVLARVLERPLALGHLARARRGVPAVLALDQLVPARRAGQPDRVPLLGRRALGLRRGLPGRLRLLIERPALAGPLLRVTGAPGRSRPQLLVQRVGLEESALGCARLPNRLARLLNVARCR